MSLTNLEHLYIHVPFCARRCSYCDFAIAVRSVTPVAEFLDALRMELHQHDTTSWNLSTLYLGGGTPSRLGGTGVHSAIDLIRSTARLDPDAEITIEVNPDDVSADVAQAWVHAGINRVSLGVQSFHDSVLKWMHRTHTAEQARHAVKTLRESGITNISVDLIFAVPEQLERNWERDVSEALELRPTHISLYGLTIEEQTPLGRWQKRGEIVEADEDRYEADFLHAHSTLSEAGFEHYEVSNYALPGLRSRHNSSYWSGVPYLGLGPSAHSFDISSRFWNVREYVQWRDALKAGQSVVGGSEILTEANREAERVYLGLRTTSGLELTEREAKIVEKWISLRWAVKSGGTIVLTPSGWLRLDALAAALSEA